MVTTSSLKTLFFYALMFSLLAYRRSQRERGGQLGRAVSVAK